MLICEACDLNIGGECGLCGCHIETKVQDANESCPATPSKWTSVTIKKEHPSKGCSSCTKRK